MPQPAISNIYRPLQPRASPLYRVIERFLPQFEQRYGDRYAARYGPWRGVIGDAARAFLRCGDLHFGFARVRCPDCRHAMFVAFSCRQRCLCPGCHQKRTLPATATPVKRRGTGCAGGNRRSEQQWRLGVQSPSPQRKELARGPKRRFQIGNPLD